MPRRSEEIPYQQFASLHLDSDFERQTPMFQISGVGRQYPVQRNTESSMGILMINRNHIFKTKLTVKICCIGLFRASSTTDEVSTPCVICGIQATLVCTICRTRYCSPVCQGSDWPTHQPICRPPP
jgi:tudor domain-containing protein 1/4/6/7